MQEQEIKEKWSEQRTLTEKELEKYKATGELPFVRLNGVETYAATSSDVFFENVKKNLKRDLKKLPQLEGFQVVKGHSNPIALVGGGPSIKKELDRIKDFELAGYPIIACGSSHDWLIENNIKPTYCTICDPDPVSAEYLKKSNKDIIYLVASSCDEAVFKALEGCEIYLWHCDSEEVRPKILAELETKEEYQGIAGGCTVGLRSICIAIVLGYTNIHFWGFDSCLGDDDKHHAYSFATDKEETGKIIKLKCGKEEDLDNLKIYSVMGYQLAQAWNFEYFYKTYHQMFTPTFHGEGMLPYFYGVLKKELDEAIEKEKQKVA